MKSDLPQWFKDKYTVELNAEKETDKYWVELGDAVKLMYYKPNSKKNICVVCGDKFDFVSAFVSLCDGCKKQYELKVEE